MWFFKFNENLKCDFFYLGSWDYKGENELQNELTK